MKIFKILLFSLVSFLFISKLTYAQIEEYCGTEGVATQMAMSSQGDGEFITAHGSLRILVVFARFPDDNTAHNHWPASGFPDLADTFIDPTTSIVDAGNYWNITNYFKEMSLGQYNVIGDVEKVVAPYASDDSRYSGLSDNQFRRKANQDVLEYIDNNTSVTFADYDNWTRNSSYVHSDSSDGVVDMIFMIWKGTWFGGFRGEASMGYGSGSLLVDNGNTEIKFGFPTGSGVTIHDNSNSTYLLNTVKHELGHWLLGGGHPYSGSQQTRIASMLHWAEPLALSTSAPERERLGWISVPEVSPGTSSETLDDFITTGEAFKYKVQDGSTNEYYYITNHQNINMYDDATVNDDDKGIFILHDRNSHTNSSSNRYLLSDGDWDWENVGEVINPWGDGSSTIPAFERKEVDLNGQNFSTMMPVHGGEFAWLYALVDPQTADTLVATHFRGTNMTSTYSKNIRPVLAPHTNPKPQTWSGQQLPFAMHVVDQSGSEITVNFYTDYDPYTITENTIWGGQIFLDQNTKVENNATLTILPGTTVYMAENVGLDIRAGQGGTLISEGTEQDPIRFLRTDTTKAWKTIYLNSSAGNSIKWTLFDGGETNLTIASKNNTIEHSTFRNATYRNINTWHNNDGSGNSSATLSHVLIENAATVGIVAQYTNLDISNTTIQDNTQAGLYIVAGTVNPFHHNIVTGNGSSSRDGIEVKSSGTLLMRESLYLEGHNEVSGNGDDQISNYGSLEVGQGYNGENSIYGSYDANKKYVENHSGSTVAAVNTWWGVAQPVSGMFKDPVDYYAPLTSDPLTGITHGYDGQAPAKALMPPNSVEEEYDQVEALLSQAETRQEVRDRLHRLFILTFQGEDPALTVRFNALARNASEGQVALQSGTEVTNKAFQDYAKVLYTKSLIRNERYEETDEFLKQLDTEGLLGYDRRDYLHLRLVTEAYHGRYPKALETLKEYYAFQESQGEDMEEVKAINSVIEEDLMARLEAGEGEIRDNVRQAEAVSENTELSLNNYPNPFNPTTQIRFTLPEQSQVSLVVYDMLGRQVARLVDDLLPAGEQTVRFDASNLANGVYIYRLNANKQERVRMMTLVK